MSASNACGCGLGSMGMKLAGLVLMAGAIGVADSHFAAKGRKIETLGMAAPSITIEEVLGGKGSSPAPGAAEEPLAPGGQTTHESGAPDPSPAPTGVAAPAKPAPAPPAPASKPAHAHLENGVSIEQGKALFDRMQQSGDVVFVDARNAPEFEAGRVAGAINLSPDRFFGALPPELESISRDFVVVVYCGGGECDASVLVGKRFNEQGYMKVFIMEDGYPGWKNAGHPVEGKN